MRTVESISIPTPTPTPIACVLAAGDLDALFRACARLTPRVERHPNALVLDLSGCERLILATPASVGASAGRPPAPIDKPRDLHGAAGPTTTHPVAPAIPRLATHSTHSTHLAPEAYPCNFHCAAWQSPPPSPSPHHPLALTDEPRDLRRAADRPSPRSPLAPSLAQSQSSPHNPPSPDGLPAQSLLCDGTITTPLAPHPTSSPTPAIPPAPTAATDWPALAAALHAHLCAACPADAALTLRVGLAPTRATAWLAATAHPETPAWRALPPRAVAPFLRTLPLAALRTLPDLANTSTGAAATRDTRATLDALDALDHAGVQTLDHLARLGVSTLRRRFGPLGTALAALAAGQDLTPLRPEVPAAWLGVRLRLTAPTAPDQLAPALTLLADRLAATLRQRRQQAHDLALVLRLEGRPPLRAIRHLGQPAASPAALLDHAQRLLATLLADTPDGAPSPLACDAVHLRAGGLCPTTPRQEILWTGQQQRERRANRERLLAAGSPLAAHRAAASLLHAHITSPHAVLPEERYTLRRFFAA